MPGGNHGFSLPLPDKIKADHDCGVFFSTHGFNRFLGHGNLLRGMHNGQTRRVDFAQPGQLFAQQLFRADY